MPNLIACCTSGSPSSCTSARSQKSARYSCLLGQQAGPAGVLGCVQRAQHLILQCRRGTHRGPAVGDELHQPQLLAWLQRHRHGEPGDVRSRSPLPAGTRPGLRRGAAWPPRPAACSAGCGARASPWPALRRVAFAAQRCGEVGGRPRVMPGRRQLLVGRELRLDDDLGRTADGLDRVADGGHRAMR